MRVAWFRASQPRASDLLDDRAPVIAALARAHTIDIVTEADAHDFVWRDYRRPHDVYVYESGHSRAHAFMRAYRPHYPGIIAPRGLGVAAPRARPEPDARTNPQLPVPTGGTPVASGFSRKALAVGLLDDAPVNLVRRALDRACAAGAAAELVSGEPPEVVLRRADIIVAREWPPLPGPPTPALLGMAAGLPVIVLEVEATAVWPAFDPQTWQPRDFDGQPPIVVSIDPRDEEHSLMLAIKRLAADASLRATLGAAGQGWWRANATVEHAVAQWELILADAVSTWHAPPPAADRTQGVRAVLDTFGVTVDFL
jgi:hypothetical protein